MASGAFLYAHDWLDPGDLEDQCLISASRWGVFVAVPHAPVRTIPIVCVAFFDWSFDRFLAGVTRPNDESSGGFFLVWLAAVTVDYPCHGSLDLGASTWDHSPDG